MKQRGFTIIEAVVATAVFAFVVSSVIGVFVAALQIDRKTRAQRAVVQNARYIMEYIAKEIRNGQIYYPNYSTQTAADDIDELHILNQAGDIEAFQLVGNNCATAVCNIVLSKGSSFTNLNGDDVRVTKAEFRAYPDTDPFTAAKTTNIQPYVTVILELTSNIGARTQDQAVINVQSTFTERYYPRR
jgi:type II secretory pathway pseudopilin PulG